MSAAWLRLAEPQRRFGIKGPRAAELLKQLKFAVPEELQCLINRWKPAQTAVVIDTSPLAFGGPMQGTP